MIERFYVTADWMPKFRRMLKTKGIHEGQHYKVMLPSDWKAPIRNELINGQWVVYYKEVTIICPDRRTCHYVEMMWHMTRHDKDPVTLAA